MKSYPEYVTAIAALTKIVEIKRFGSLEDYSYLMDIPLVQEINQKAKQEITVDLFESKDASALAKYTTFLNEQIKKDILPTTSAAGIEDEIELLSNVENFSPKSLREYKIDFYIARDKELENSYMHALGITKPNIVSLVYNVDYAQEIKISKKTGRVFLLSVKTQIRSIDCIILFILMEVDESISFLSLDKRLSVSGIYVFNKTNSRFNSPARLFLQMLDKYGQSVTFGFKTQRFFYNGVIPGTYGAKDLDKIFSQKFNVKFVHGGTRRTPLGLEYYFFYVIDIERLVADIRKRAFL